MGIKKGKKFKRAVTVLMSAVLIVETVNCANLTAFASEGSVSAGDSIAMDEELKELVNTAENADKAAYEAAQAAEEALKAAEELAGKAAEAALETDSEGNYTQTVDDGNGGSVEQPVLEDTLDQKITDAEQKTAEANKNTGTVQQETEAALADVVVNAEADTAEKLTEAADAADAAETAKTAAEQAAEKAKNAVDQFTAEKQAKKAQEAADQAQAAADQAKAAYEESVKILNDAADAYNNLVAAAEASVAAGTQDAQAALDAAQAALDAAQAAVDAAAAEYEEAMQNSAKAGAAATEAATQAAEAAAAADGVVSKLEEAKQVDQESLKAQKADKEAALAKAQTDKAAIDAEQDQVIADEQAKKEAADAKITAYNEAKERKAELEYAGISNGWSSEISQARTVASKNAGDRKPFSFARYTQQEIDAAKAVVAEYDAANALVDSTDIVALREQSAAAQNSIADAQQKKADAANTVNTLTTEIAGLTASLATITDYIYSNEDAEVTYLDKDKQAEYQELADQLSQSFAAYQEIKQDTEAYIAATADPGFLQWLGGLFTGETWSKWFDELDLEAKYHGWKTQDGTYIVIQSDKDNTQALVTIRDDKAYIASIDEAEFATYSATFDKVAASQAAAKAAEAAQAEDAALKKYNAAVEALKAAQARLDAAKLKKLDLENAQKALAEAQKNVDASKQKWEDAQKAADEAQKAADEAQKAVGTKPVKVAFYVLNRGLAQPSEVSSYPKGNYSSKIMGELYSGEQDPVSGARDDSYISLYKKGIKDAAAIPQYIMTAPTAEQLASIGVELKEGESLVWYVIKTEADGYHVDGFISNQTFSIEVQYGYTDGEGNFVEITKEDGSTYAQKAVYGLGETYSFTSPVIDDYNAAELAVVSGTATKDLLIQVEYTKEATAPVTIHYYRGSLEGTLLHSSSLDVAQSKIPNYAETINAKWLNAYKPADCNDGVLVSYTYEDGAAVANVVYSLIPSETVPAGNPGTGDTAPAPLTTGTDGEAVGLPVAEAGAPAPAAVAAAAPAAAPAPVETPVVEVEEEATPLAPDVESEEDVLAAGRVTEVEEEAVPLAAEVDGNCMIHWMILLLTACYTAYELVRSIRRNKQIKEAEAQGQSVEA